MSVRILARPKLDYKAVDGTVPMCIRITIDGKNDWIKLGRTMKASSWDKVNSKVKSGVANSAQLERFFNKRKEWIHEIIDELEKQGHGVVTKEEIQRRYDERMGRGAMRTTCFLQFVADYLEWEEKNDERVSSSTIRLHRQQLNRLTNWWNNKGSNKRKKHPILSPAHMTKQLILEYTGYITRRYPKNISAAWAADTFLRKYLKRMQAKGVINTHPYDEKFNGRIIVGSPPMIEMAHFNIEELKELTELFFSERLLLVKPDENAKPGKATALDLGGRLQSTLHHFLMGCYTGLRRSDIERLNRHEHIQGDFIVIKVKKGRSGKHKTVRIPIKRIVRDLLNYVSPRIKGEAAQTKFINSGNIFHMDMIGSTSENRYLRQIVNEHTSIDKPKFNFHSSRHTFGVVGLLLGMKLEVVKDILGHSEVETTLRYARVVDQLRESDMNYWDDLASSSASEQSVKELKDESQTKRDLPVELKHPSGGQTVDTDLIQIECPTCGTIDGQYKTGMFKMRFLRVECGCCGVEFKHVVG